MVREKAKALSPRTEGAQAVGRAVEILRAVARCQRSGATLAKVMSVTTLSRSTSFRLLRYLTEERLLQFHEEDRTYFIGPLAYELGLAHSTVRVLMARACVKLRAKTRTELVERQRSLD